ncbi:coiled-coil domain-containing protein [Catellatospora chokoriensis]|uniref:ARB-07466-like C-terminal domain-containing protein n=1 Tax=Catellatospora chokoriensis TaxID=310353 RepID=A0A8J3K5T8_9ACTN|nr:hypothetical protein [Catellatospora chokoriensis]GIF89079.1 hypothetical protein Cch02nite_25230 [Catellatospora chokoriensis]
MTLTVRPRRRFVPAIAVAVAAAVLVTAFPTAAQAEPNEISSTKVAQLRQTLESAAGQYLEAEGLLTKAKTEQAALNQKLVVADNRYQRAKNSVQKYAAEAYKAGRLGVIGVMLNANTPESFLARSAALEKMTARDEARISELVSARKEIDSTKAEIDNRVREQNKQLSEMAKLRSATERALSAVGGYTTTGWVDPYAPTAAPAKRNSDGSWPSQGCTVNDPTPANGCITPRTLHALQQAQRWFDHYVSCYRSGDMYEHPKGRACDFSSEPDGFKNFSSKGANKLYGDKLASFFVKNASRLGVMYVIWYCKIWLAGSGWKTYRSAGGNCGDDPAGDHTNHVHLSVL